MFVYVMFVRQVMRIGLMLIEGLPRGSQFKRFQGIIKVVLAVAPKMEFSHAFVQSEND